MRDVEQWIIGLIQRDDIIKFYKSKTTWRPLRAEVLAEQHNECQMCRDKGIAETATTVHHIKHLKQRPDLALDKSNLLCVCEDHHYRLHHTIVYKPQLNIERWD